MLVDSLSSFSPFLCFFFELFSFSVCWSGWDWLLLVSASVLLFLLWVLLKKSSPEVLEAFPLDGWLAFGFYKDYREKESGNGSDWRSKVITFGGKLELKRFLSNLAPPLRSWNTESTAAIFLRWFWTVDLLSTLQRRRIFNTGLDQVICIRELLLIHLLIREERLADPLIKRAICYYSDKNTNGNANINWEGTVMIQTASFCPEVLSFPYMLIPCFLQPLI